MFKLYIMIQKITLSIAFSFLAFIGYSQEAPETQSSLITKISATWCPPCGGWGWDMFHDLIKDNEEKATLIAVHHSGDLVTPTSAALADNFMITGQPQFFMGNVNQSVFSSSAAAKRVAIQAAVNEMADQAPIINTGLIATYTDATQEINVSTQTEFFQDADANYYLGVYIVNDGYVGPQTNRGTNAEHEKVLVSSFTTSHFGEQLTTGAVTDGDIMEGFYTIAIDPAWDVEKLEVLSIIWSEVDGVYTYVNSNVTTNIELAVSSEFLAEAVSDFTIEPTIMTNDISTINFELFDRDTYTINILDQTGRLVKSVFKGELNAGTQRFEVARNDLEVAGIYYVTIESAAGKSTRELIVK